MVFWAWLVPTLVLGIGVGCWGMRLFMRQRHIGTLREDRSDPDEAPYLFLELEPGGMEKIHRCRMVSLNVKLESYLPRR